MKIAKTYYGKSCIRCGHTERYIKSRRAENPEKVKAFDKKWRAENPEKVKANNKKWKTLYPEYYKKWDDENPEKRNAYHKKWRTKDAGQTSAKYRATKRNQTPPDADTKLMQKIYRNCPEGYEVDHKIPLSKGGLHHQDNLQYLTIHDNRSKGSKIL